MTGYTGRDVVGENCSAGLLRHVDENGRAMCGTRDCPVARVIADGRVFEQEVFVHHRDGHRVSVNLRAMPMRGADGRVTGVAQVFTDNSPRVAVLQRVKELEKMAMADPVTGLGNRRFMEVNIQSRLAAMQRYGWSFALLFMDIDRFKGVNDMHGREVGDHVLLMVAKTLLNSLRPFDTVGRWGGEEFVAVLLNVSEDQLHAVADRYRALIEQSGFTTGTGSLRVTVSIGATLARPGDTSETILDRADELLRRSKAAGRNCVTVQLDERS